MLEHQCGNQKSEDTQISQASPTTPSGITQSLSNNSLKYIPGAPIPQQPMFVASILSALKLVSLKHIITFYLSKT